MQNLIYIYSLSEQGSDKIRYVGKTKFELKIRLKQHLYDNKKCYRYYWLQSLKKQGKQPEIELIDIVPENEWQFWEIHYISLFKSWGFNLVNSTTGGEGIDGFSHSNETKEKLRQINLGKKHSEETKIKCRNRKPSDITKKAIAKKLSLPIIQLTLNGKFLKEWQSSRETSRQLKIQIGALSDCLNKKTSSCNDSIWIFKSEYDNSKNYFISKEKRYKKKVAQLSYDGKIIKVWKSIREASLYLKINSANITSCCQDKRKNAGGFKWKYF